MKTVLRWATITALSCVVGLLLVSPAASADMPVPAELQAAIFKRVFEYAKAFATPDEVTVFVTGSDGAAGDVVKAFQAAGIKAKAMPAADLGKNVSPKSVVYILGDLAAAKGVCESNGVLSITGIPSMVESGDVSVGLGVDAGKPKIIVNRARLTKEKHELSAKLLQLARVL